MLKVYCFILFFLVPLKALALQVKLTADDSDFYFILINKTNIQIDIAKRLILGDCEYFANICMKVVNEDKKVVKILAGTMDFDHSFKDRIILTPSKLYGVKKNKNKVIRRYGLKNGCYQVSLIYQDKKHDLIAESESIPLAVAEGKAIAECDTSFWSKFTP